MAADRDRLEEYRRIAAFNRKCGVDVQEISAKEVERLFPLCRTEDILAGFYVKEDGRANPVDATTSLAKGARMHGAKIFENVRVENVLERRTLYGHRQVDGVVTECGQTIKADYVVNCAGMWARQIGEKSKITIPNQAAEHYYIITDAMPGVDPNWPVVEDPSSYTYIRPEAGGLMVGLFEPEGAVWNPSKIPKSFSFGEITPDWDRMAPHVEKAMNRVPATLTAGVKNFFCGPESFSPDLAPIVGEAPEMKNYFVAAGKAISSKSYFQFNTILLSFLGLNSIGILSGGGIGRVVASWIINGKPDVDVTGMNIDRLQKFQSTPAYRSTRVTESLGLVYKCHYPYKSNETARKSKRSPFYDSLMSVGAVCKDVSGWEVPDWYKISSTSSNLMEGDNKYTWGKPHFFNAWAHEHQACRNSVALFDMSFMSKFLVVGKDAGECLNRYYDQNIS